MKIKYKVYIEVTEGADVVRVEEKTLELTHDYLLPKAGQSITYFKNPIITKKIIAVIRLNRE